MSVSSTVHLQSASAAAVAVAEAPEPNGDADSILAHVLAELGKTGNHATLVTMLESGSAALQGNELAVTVARTDSFISLAVTAEARQAANAAASAAAGRFLKVNVRSGGSGEANASATAPVPARNGVGARSRAAEEPVVQRMREKFGAEIRTVIDHREKN
jgi:hypothetical protein